MGDECNDETLTPLNRLRSASCCRCTLRLDLCGVVLRHGCNVRIRELFLNIFRPGRAEPCLIPIPFLRARLGLILREQIRSFVGW